MLLRGNGKKQTNPVYPVGQLVSASTAGWLDGVIAADNIREACTGDDTSQCEIVSYQEGGGFVGSAISGFVAGEAGAALATGIAVLLGISGAPIVAIALIGAGIGSYLGSKGGDFLGEITGEKRYEYKLESFK